MTSKIELTWSKLMALLVLLYAYHMDLRTEDGYAALMYALPFIVIMIGAKQVMDSRKKETEKK